MTGVLVLVVVERGFEPRSVNTKTIKFVFVASTLSTHPFKRRNNKDWLAWNRDNMSVWSDMSTIGLFTALKNPTKRVGLVQCGYHYHLIECNLFSPCYG